MTDMFRRAWLDDVVRTLRAQKQLADRAVAQLTDEDLYRTIDDEANSIAVLMHHLAGNMRSRWTDFLASDGEKPWRDRDAEFVAPGDPSRASLVTDWEDGWRTLLGALESLAPDDLERTVTIRGEPHSVVAAVNRALAHYANHVGQIVLLAKHARGAAWETLSIPRGGSRAFNEAHPPR